MKDFRDLLRTRRPFDDFEMYCQECNETLFEQDELAESTFKNEVLILYRIQSHTNNTGHRNIGGVIEPITIPKTIDMSIEVGRNV